MLRGSSDPEASRIRLGAAIFGTPPIEGYNGADGAAFALTAGRSATSIGFHGLPND